MVNASFMKSLECMRLSASSVGVAAVCAARASSHVGVPDVPTKPNAPSQQRHERAREGRLTSARQARLRGTRSARQRGSRTRAWISAAPHRCRRPREFPRIIDIGDGHDKWHVALSDEGCNSVGRLGKRRAPLHIDQVELHHRADPRGHREAPSALVPVVISLLALGALKVNRVYRRVHSRGARCTVLWRRLELLLNLLSHRRALGVHLV
eukprot:scaffold57085_cov31-Tisochrysis_lutea.AAC.1